jgi:hypothetical protein
MDTYLFVYHGGTIPQTEEDVRAVTAAWLDWFAALGERVIDGGNPVGPVKTVAGDGVVSEGASNPVTGYSLIAAETLQDALDAARGCPILGRNGSVEVAEIYDVM